MARLHREIVVNQKNVPVAAGLPQHKLQVVAAVVPRAGRKLDVRYVSIER